jgi:hypothetical protein
MRREFDPDRYAECLEQGHIWSVTTEHCRHCGMTHLMVLNRQPDPRTPLEARGFGAIGNPARLEMLDEGSE